MISAETDRVDIVGTSAQGGEAADHPDGAMTPAFHKWQAIRVVHSSPFLLTNIDGVGEERGADSVAAT